MQHTIINARKTEATQKIVLFVSILACLVISVNL